MPTYRKKSQVENESARHCLTGTTTMYDRNRARNKLTRANTQENVNNYKHRKQIAQHVIKDTAQSYWHDYCDTQNSTTRLGAVWNMAKHMNGVHTNVANKHLIGNQTFESNIDKAEVLAQSFAQVSSSANYSQKRKTEVESRVVSWKTTHSQ